MEPLALSATAMNRTAAPLPDNRRDIPADNPRHTLPNHLRDCRLDALPDPARAIRLHTWSGNRLQTWNGTAPVGLA